MSLIDKVVYYLNDVLVSLDIAPVQEIEAKSKNKNNTATETDINV
ncbi:hypothetical protein [uncultured Kordia sp.]|nr:hypothetical protein [uncultured Kordia sp.]